MDIIKTYNPGNKLNDEEQSAMVNLTNEQIADLAKAYPNQPTGNAYLEYWMKNEKDIEQRFPLGTWANLNSLRKLGREDILPYRFRSSFSTREVQPFVQAPAQRVVDLSAKEAVEAEGLKSVAVVPVQDAPAPEPVKQPVSPEQSAAQAELQQAIDDKAHHMTIKSLQAKVDGLAEPVSINLNAL
jgi:hypothetical protein